LLSFTRLSKMVVVFLLVKTIKLPSWLISCLNLKKKLTLRKLRSMNSLLTRPTWLVKSLTLKTNYTRIRKSP